MSRAAAGALGLALAGLAAAGPPAVPASAVAVLPSGAEFRLEVAADDLSRQRGYMFRERVGPREGMLFLFDAEDRHGFWMKNCLVALDIVWLDARLRVVDVAHRQPPCAAEGECRPVRPMRAARYVLEFAGGTAEAERLKPGDRIEILSEPPLF